MKWERLKKNVADQEKADAEQKEFDDSPEDSWQRRFRKKGMGIRHNLPWGASSVMAGCPIIDNWLSLFTEEDLAMNQAAAELLNQINQCQTRQ